VSRPQHAPAGRGRSSLPKTINLSRADVTRTVVFVLALAALVAGYGPPGAALHHEAKGYRPLVIAHRGASGYRPEHTLEAYELAIEQGADFIEPDLVLTRDGVFIARHENELSGTTDVADKFPGARTHKTIDGRGKSGWFSEDYSLAQIKTLRAKERLPFRDHSRDGRYTIATFEEIIALVKRKQRELGRPIGIVPELKHPTYFASIGLSMADRLVKVLQAHGYDSETAPVFIQCFETEVLKRLGRMTRARRMQLIGSPRWRPYDLAAAGDPRTYADMMTPEGLREIGRYAQAIGPNKRHILPLASGGTLKAPTSLVRDAHRAGLLVFPYTFRSEPRYLAGDYDGEPAREYRRFFELGVDGVFSDFPDVAVKAREAFVAR
jgi:glycerophosphoryl diester phosphodiesterase